MIIAESEYIYPIIYQPIIRIMQKLGLWWWWLFMFHDCVSLRIRLFSLLLQSAVQPHVHLSLSVSLSLVL